VIIGIALYKNPVKVGFYVFYIRFHCLEFYLFDGTETAGFNLAVIRILFFTIAFSNKKALPRGAEGPHI
jgi:hypothetical protein